MRWMTLLLSVFMAQYLHAQFANPVTWSYDWKALGGNEYELVFTAEIEEGWKIYSQYLESDEGPIRTSFHYDNPDAIELIGKNEESGKISKAYEPLFDMEIISIKEKATFRQKIRLLDDSQPLTGYLEYMSCNDETCTPPMEEMFSFALAGGTAGTEQPPEALISDAQGLATPSTGEEPSQSGILKPVTWAASAKKLDEQTFSITLIGAIQKGWTLYSQDVSPDAGPVPTEVTLKEGNHYSWDGIVSEEAKKIKEGYDNVFGVDLKKIVDGPARYTVTVTVHDNTQPVAGEVFFMTCDDKQCLPPEYVDFVLDPATGTALAGTAASEFLEQQNGQAAEGATDGPTYAMNKPDLEAPVGTCSTDQVQPTKTGIWSIFGLGFLGGLLALLTPCVFPMIPLTVSFFTKSSGDRSKGIRDAVMYGGFILLVYLVLSIPFHLMDSINPDILNDISTNIWLNLFFFAVFVFFAFSFFGYYELTLPEKWTNRASQAEGVGGVLGIFFMALTLALVSFSCTGPILGSLLAGALTSDGGAWQLTAGMGGFGLALALPFALFALFPGMMKSLPKSGGWLNTVKVVLGFLELALALKFLSNADLVKHWGILKIEPFLGLWILIFLGLALYLFGVIKFPHDSPIKKLGIGRTGLGVLSFAFVLYLASGFIYSEQSGSYRPLKLLSGLAPPVCYSWVHNCDCPQNLECFKDLDDGLAYAKKQNKPVMIDFTGHACVNCRKMEEHVWPEREVYTQLRDDYVLISLYVDDKRELPQEEQVVVEKATGGKRKLRRVGDKWAHFQTEYFQTNTQPYYVLLSPDGEQLLNAPVGYTPNVGEFADFLQCGQDAFRRMAEIE